MARSAAFTTGGAAQRLSLPRTASTLPQASDWHPPTGDSAGIALNTLRPAGVTATPARKARSPQPRPRSRMSPRFIHLHLHSEYSLSDSTIRLSKLVARCVELGLPAVAVTDQGNLFALVKFWRDAARSGVKPITGSDVFVESGGASPDRLTLLCQSHRGYLSLSRLLSRGFLDGHHGDHVAIGMDWLLGDADDLIVLAGRQSPIGRQAGCGRGAAAAMAADLRRPPLPGADPHRPRGRGGIHRGSAATRRHLRMSAGCQQRRALHSA